MQVSVETLSSLERRMTVTLPAESIDAEVEKRVQRAAGSVRLDGFRRGKVPMKVVRQRFGQSVRQEVLGEMINQKYFEAVQAEGLQPAGMPAIDAKGGEVDGKDFEFTATFEVFPEIQLGDFSKVSVTRLSGEVQDSDIDDMLANLREQQAAFAVVERAAQSGDQVVYDYEGCKDGVAFDGGKADNATLVLGSGQMIPGFEDALIGMSAGDEKTADITFPAEYHSEELKGQAVQFKLKLHSVSEKKLPELNDEFFARFGVEEGGEATFREEVRKNMTREMSNAAMNKLKAALIDEVLKVNDVQVPKALIANEVDSMRNQMVQQFGEMAKQLDVRSIFPDEMFAEQATKRVATGLVFAELVRQRELKVDADRVRAKVEELAAVYNNPQEVVDHYYANRQLLTGVENLVLEEQVVDLILESAKVEEKTVGYKEVIGRDEAEQAE